MLNPQGPGLLPLLPLLFLDSLVDNLLSFIRIILYLLQHLAFQVGAHRLVRIVQPGVRPVIIGNRPYLTLQVVLKKWDIQIQF